MKHTKGQWNVSSSSLVVSEEGKMISNCLQFISIPELSISLEEAEANAHLIAAAPELLEALKSAVNLIDTLTDNIESEEAIEIYGQYYTGFLNAINKAEGR